MTVCEFLRKILLPYCARPVYFQYFILSCDVIRPLKCFVTGKRRDSAATSPTRMSCGLRQYRYQGV